MLRNALAALVLGAGFAAVVGGAWVAYRGRVWRATVARFGDPSEAAVATLDPGQVTLAGTVRRAASCSRGGPAVPTWPGYAPVAAGAFFAWSAVTAWLHAEFGVDLPVRGRLPGDE